MTVLNLLTYEQINDKMVSKSRKKIFGKAHTNCRTMFSTKGNTYAGRYDKYNDWIRFKTWTLLRFSNLILMVVTIGVSIIGNYGEFIYNVKL